MWKVEGGRFSYRYGGALWIVACGLVVPFFCSLPFCFLFLHCCAQPTVMVWYSTILVRYNYVRAGTITSTTPSIYAYAWLAAQPWVCAPTLHTDTQGRRKIEAFTTLGKVSLFASKGQTVIDCY